MTFFYINYFENKIPIFPTIDLPGSKIILELLFFKNFLILSEYFFN
jgi:hypothetical protein